MLPLVFGAFADVNGWFEKLISNLASHGASVHWRSLMANSITNAKGVLQWRIRRTIGMAIHKANADLVLDRLPLIGARASAHAARRVRDVQLCLAIRVLRTRATHTRAHAGATLPDKSLERVSSVVDLLPPFLQYKLSCVKTAPARNDS